MTDVRPDVAVTRTPTGTPRLIDTQSFVFWVFVVAVIFSGLHLYSTLSSDPLIAVPGIAWLALVQWFVYALIFLVIVYRHQLFVRRPLSITLAALAWGGLVGVWFAMESNQALEDIFSEVISPEWNSKWGLSVSAATIEETLKMLGIVALFLLPLALVKTSLDGFFYGMMVGLGFQVVEDFVYTVTESGSLGEGFNFLITRGIVAGLWAHAVYSGIVGFGIGYLVSRRDKSVVTRIAVAVGLFAFAWLMHWFWDSDLLRSWGENSTWAFFGVVLIKGAPALAVLLLVLRWGRRHERTAWNAVVTDEIDRSLIPDSDRIALLDRKGRRAARRAARRAGGRHAARVQQQLQFVQLRYVQSVVEEGATSPNALALADDVRELQALATTPATTP